MEALISSVPDTNGLAAGLQATLIAQGPVTIVGRRPNIHASSLSSEFVTCRLPDGREVELFCKYSDQNFDSCHGHRGSVEYEAAVYRHVLDSTDLAAPKFVGKWNVDSLGHSCLAIQAISHVERITEDAEPEIALIQAAGEIGAFHAKVARRYVNDFPSFLRRYDRDYYTGWIRRTSFYGGKWHERFPWLARLCEHAESLIDPLLNVEQTIIHGELYPHNVLCGNGKIYLIDWQSTAIGSGEIDLASLTEKWPDDVVVRCKQAYVKRRWPEGAPPSFEPTLAIARLYLVFRWLGDRPEWTARERSDWGFGQLRQLAIQLELTER